MSSQGVIGSGRAVRLIARRELQARLFSKAFLVSLAVTVAIVFGVFGIGALLADDDPLRLGLVGDQPTGAEASIEAIAQLQGSEVELIEYASRDEATTAIEAGDVDAVVVDGRELVMQEADDAILALVSPAWQQAALVDGMAAQGLDGGEIDAALADAAPLSMVELEPDPDAGAKEAVAFASVVLLFISIQYAGAYIMMGVFEEKSTKVVELVLSSVRARDLLVGKIVGVGVIGMVQVVGLAGSALIGASTFGSGALPVLSVSLIGTAIIWFLLGYLLYGAIFAAGASLAPRQEDAQSTLGPVSAVLMLSYFGAIFSAANPDSVASRIISWLPITAPFTMPGRTAAGNALWWEVIGSMVLTAVAASVVLLLAERIYVRSVIHTDRKLGWREAWSMRT